jgi:transcriptional regulator with XRE-family HTH domain
MMSTFGKRLRECREAKQFSQHDLAKLLETSYTVIGKYERDEMKPSIEAARNIARLVGTTVGYLLGETDEMDALKDPAMLKRLNDLNALSEADRDGILYALDGLLRDAKARKAYAH